MVFIWNITDMRKDNLSEKLFNLTHIGVKVVAVIMLVVYLSLSTQKNTNKTFLSFVAPAVIFVIFLLYNRLLVHFHKKGSYTSAQAAEFYTKCRERDIYLFQEENIEKAKDVYFSIFGTDKYTGEGTLPAHMERIYNAGMETIEKR